MAKNGELCSTRKVNCVAKTKTGSVVRQSILNFKCLGRGVLNGVLVGILVYLSDGINIIS